MLWRGSSASRNSRPDPGTDPQVCIDFRVREPVWEGSSRISKDETTMTKRHVLAALAAVSLVAVPALAAQNGNMFRTRLSVVPIDVAMQVNVAGQGAITATLNGNKLTVSGNAAGLRSPATTAKIHRGKPGIPGPAILDLTVTKAAAPTIGGTVDLTPTMVQDLRNGDLYVQLNSERAPEGNLRGWLTLAN